MPQTHFYNLFAVFLFCIFVLYFLLDNVLESISQLGLYHELNCSDLLIETKTDPKSTTTTTAGEGVQTRPDCVGYGINIVKGVVYTFIRGQNGDTTKEFLYEKISKITKVYAWLSFLLIICFYVVLTNQIFVFNIEPSTAYILSITVALSTLLVVRVLSNPSDDPALSKHFKDAEKKGIFDIHKERVLSFLYSFIAAYVFFLAVMLIGYTIYNFDTVTKSANAAEASNLITNFISSISLEYFFLWVILLFCCSIIGELILSSIKPKYKADRVSR